MSQNAIDTEGPFLFAFLTAANNINTQSVVERPDLKHDQDTNYSMGGMVINTQGTNYSMRGVVINTQDNNYSMGGMVTTLGTIMTPSEGW